MDISGPLRKYKMFTELYSVRLLTYSTKGACIRLNVMVHFNYYDNNNNNNNLYFLSKTKYILVFYKSCGYIQYDRSASTITT